jgi:enediyne biosynthesis protein E4
MRRTRLWLGVGIVAATLVAGSVWVVDERRARSELETARSELKSGQAEKARRRLEALRSKHSLSGEVALLVGQAEQARGRTDLALAAWAQVPASSPFAGAARMRCAAAEIRRGRLADAEDLLLSALKLRGPHQADARESLVRLLRSQGRNEEARRLFIDGVSWSPTDSPARLVAAIRRLYKLDTDSYPVDGIRTYLTSATKRAPDDDRAWLGWAHLETRLGRLEEADRWLSRCLERRPQDSAVWQARLEWALAARRVDAMGLCLKRLSINTDSQRQVLLLRAWAGAQRGSSDLERRALDELHRIDPAHVSTIERLAELEIQAGRVDRAAELRRSKAKLEQSRDAYERQLRSQQPEAHASELAGLAQKLGRELDAAAWSALASRTPLTFGNSKMSSKGTLADLLPELVAVDGKTPSTAPRAVTVPEFRDDAETSGLRFIHQNGASNGRLIPPVSMSGGVALLDYDGDGWLDVYVVQGGSFPPTASPDGDGDRLFHNRGDGTYDDVTSSSGIANFSRGYGHGVTVGDWDNDGDPDLFITRWRHYAMYQNRGDGTFEDVTTSVGLGGDRDWPTSAAFADLDGDGDLDLYVCHYFRWEEGDRRDCTDPKDPTIYRCGPRDFPALSDHLFRNDGGRFVDVTREAGIVDRDGRGLGVVAADLDGDGRVDLFVANDMTANYFFRNLGGFHFEEQGLLSGLAANASGGYQAGMGVACGDLDGDGLIDLAVTNFYGESTTFFHNLGHGLFADHTASIGLAAPTRFMLGFGISFLDVNNDGYREILTANGHTHDGRPQFPWAMPVQLLIGGPSGTLTDVSNRAGPPFAVARLGRGLATGDLDNDGHVDALVLSQGEPLSFFHNKSTGGHFVTIRLEGQTSNRDAIGAVVTIEAGGRRQIAQRFGGGSYLSCGDPRLHFGLGSASQIDRVEVRWPSGKLDRFHHLAADKGYHLREGDLEARPLKGFAR